MHNDVVFRLFISISAGTGWLVLAGGLMVLLRRTDVGHRQLIAAVLAFSLFRCACYALHTYNVYQNTRIDGTDLLSFFSMISENVLVLFFILAIADIVRTLKESEEMEKARKIMIETKGLDDAQIVMISKYIRSEAEKQVPHRIEA